MARLKGTLLALFKDCKTSTDIYRAMMEAKRAGFTTEEVSQAVAKTKKELMGQAADYKRLFIKDVSINYFRQYHVGYQVTVKDINGKTIHLSKEGVIL